MWIISSPVVRVVTHLHGATFRDCVRVVMLLRQPLITPIMEGWGKSIFKNGRAKKGRKMKVKNQENNSIKNPKYSKETNEKVDRIIRRAVAQSFPGIPDGELSILISHTRTYTANNIKEIYDLVEDGSPESLIEAVIILALCS